MQKGSEECVKVIVRVRPFVEKELNMKCGDIVKCDVKNNQIDLKEPKGDFKSF